MAFSAEEAASLMSFGDPTSSTAAVGDQLHFSRRGAEGKVEKTDDAAQDPAATTGPDIYTKRVPLDMYTKFLSHCRDLEFEEAVALSKAILRIDPRDKVIQQYVPVLQAHLELQDDEEEDDEDDDDEEEEDEEEEEEEEDDDNDEDENNYEGKEDSGTHEGKETERTGASKQSRK